MQCVNCKLFVDLWIAWVSSCPCCLLDTTIVLPELPAFNLFICLCWPQTPCLQHHTTVLHSAVLPTTAAASSPSYHISTNVGRRQPLAEGTSAGQNVKEIIATATGVENARKYSYVRVDYLILQYVTVYRLPIRLPAKSALLTSNFCDGL